MFPTSLSTYYPNGQLEHEGEKPLPKDQYATQLAIEATPRLIKIAPREGSFGETSSVSGLSIPLRSLQSTCMKAFFKELKVEHA